ncbi:hypothetical protein EJ08DRAFT_528401 [Tothia fuscella]|uniref:Ankyrin repeat domain-containing protein n=1 Tax=Tothia fuscella TaxID=1048955 RepID=A0A9P4NGU1_9PEZI|nr:hypothetical protein EJ08DRAFT_528401 [Tothia fuscella]
MNSIYQDTASETLFRSCAQEALEQVRVLLNKLDSIAIALASEERVYLDLGPRRDIVLSHKELNLHHMLKVAAEAGKEDIDGLLLDFGLERDVPVQAIITGDVIYEAMKCDNNVRVFAQLVRIEPDIVGKHMGLAGDPLCYAVAGRNSESIPTSGTLELARYLLDSGADPNRIMQPHFESPGYYLH